MENKKGPNLNMGHLLTWDTTVASQKLQFYNQRIHRTAPVSSEDSAPDILFARCSTVEHRDNFLKCVYEVPLITTLPWMMICLFYPQTPLDGAVCSEKQEEAA